VNASTKFRDAGWRDAGAGAKLPVESLAIN